MFVAVQGDVRSATFATLGEAIAWTRGCDEARRAARVGGHDRDAWEVRRVGPVTLPTDLPIAEYMARLVRAFPTLAAAWPESQAWTPSAWGEWCETQGRTQATGARWAASFVCGVWSGGPAWAQSVGLPGFDAIRALGAWDAEHRAAFVAWAQAPRWG